MPFFEHLKLLMGSRYGSLDDQSCRQCSSFADYVKNTRQQVADSKKSEDLVVSMPRKDCPLDKDRLGRSTWGLLHTIASKYPETPSTEMQQDMKDFFRLLSKFYPCEHCAKDLRVDLKKEPPQVHSQHALSQWLCRLHNKVNRKIGKPTFNCANINERWRDGWNDGSCDI